MPCIEEGFSRDCATNDGDAVNRSVGAVTMGRLKCYHAPKLQARLQVLVGQYPETGAI